jgi:rare lipoprotein A
VVRLHISSRLLAGGLLAAIVACAASGTAVASSGGTAAGTTTVGSPVPAPVGATLGTITFTPSNVVKGQTTVATGALAAADAGQPVALEIQSQPDVWDSVATSTVGPSGAFAISWRTKGVTGSFEMRVVSGAQASSTASVSTPEATLNILRSVIATWYGPGFYGHRTACGEKLTRHILGVAHRTLPCGTAVTLYYKGESITVPVIDRGPYANGATFDLTSATAQALGITETVNVGFVAEHGVKIAPTNWYPAGSTGPTGVTGVSGASGVTGVSGASGSSGGGGTVAGGLAAPS